MAWLGIPLMLWAAGGLLLATMLGGAAALITENHDLLVYVMIVQGMIYAPAAFWAWRRREDSPAHARRMLVAILGLAAILRALILFAPPHSTDIYRYVWDGRVQASGVNPYLHIPDDPALAHLRDAEIQAKINRKEYAPTIYPPAAQIVFRLAAAFGDSVLVMKLVMLAFEALAIWAILKLLQARGLPSVLVLVYAWHPLAMWEVAGSGHVDIVAAAFLLLAILAAERGKAWAAGAALAAGTLTKLLPLVAAPALWRRWTLAMPLAALLTAAALILPYSSAGGAMLGFLGGYADEGGLRTGEGFLLAALLRQAGLGAAAMPLFVLIAFAVLGLLAWRILLRADPDKPDIEGAYALALAFTVLISPHHAWYYLWLVPFLCFLRSPATLYLTLAAAALYRLGWPPSLFGAGLLYGPFLALLILENRLFSFRMEASHERARA